MLLLQTTMNMPKQVNFAARENYSLSKNTLVMALLCMLVPGHLAAGDAYTRPPVRWWEQAGVSVRSVSPKCALGEGLSTLGQMRGLPAFLAMLHRLHRNNVSTLQLFTAYDSGDGYEALYPIPVCVCGGG